MEIETKESAELVDSLLKDFQTTRVEELPHPSVFEQYSWEHSKVDRSWVVANAAFDLSVTEGFDVKEWLSRTAKQITVTKRVTEKPFGVTPHGWHLQLLNRLSSIIREGEKHEKSPYAYDVLVERSLAYNDFSILNGSSGAIALFVAFTQPDVKNPFEIIKYNGVAVITQELKPKNAKRGSNLAEEQETEELDDLEDVILDFSELKQNVDDRDAVKLVRETVTVNPLQDVKAPMRPCGPDKAWPVLSEDDIQTLADNWATKDDE